MTYAAHTHAEQGEGGGMPWQMQLQLSLERPDTDAETAELLRAWFGGAFEAMGGELRQRLLAVEPLSDDLLRRRPRNDPYGQPGDVWSHVMTGVRGARGIRNRANAFSTAAWQKFLTGMDKVPATGELNICTLDQHGFPHGLPAMRVHSEFHDEDERWLFLWVLFGPDLLQDPGYQQETLSFARTFANRYNPSYGEVSYNLGGLDTAFEQRFTLRPSRTILSSRSVLRGYSWLTICPQEIGDRLGGLQALRSSAAFAEVEPLDAGGYWLLATSDYRGFDAATAERIFQVVAPALPRGKPLPLGRDDPWSHIVERDAAEVGG
jgi:hypothetical protein